MAEKNVLQAIFLKSNSEISETVIENYTERIIWEVKKNVLHMNIIIYLMILYVLCMHSETQHLNLLMSVMSVLMCHTANSQ